MRSVLLLLLVSGSLIQCSPSKQLNKVVINMDTKEQSATLQVNTTLSVLLPLKDGTAYDWSLAAPVIICSFISASVVNENNAPDPAKMMVFKLNAAGSETIRFLLKRSSSSTVEEERILYLTIQ